MKCSPGPMRIRSNEPVVLAGPERGNFEVGVGVGVSVEEGIGVGFGGDLQLQVSVCLAANALPPPALNAV